MYDTQTLQQNADAIAQEWGLDPHLFRAQIAAESGWNPSAVSSAGCVGIAQICDRVSFDPHDPVASMNYMAQRMSGSLRSYGGNYAAALAEYNCGAGCAGNWLAGKGSLPAQTQAYIATILGGATSNAPSGASSTNSSAPASAAASFSARALSSSSSTLLLFFAAAVLLLGVAAGHRRRLAGA
jgi:soluble lytic murein transglycosylase-like protein